MALFHDSAIAGASGNQGGGVGYQISRSLRFNSSDSAYLSRTPASAGNRKTWTWAGWVKRSSLGTYQRLFCNADGSGQNNGFYFDIVNDDTIRIYDYTNSVRDWELRSTQVFRDASAWYHILLAYDTTQSTANQRISLYVNGAKVTQFSTAIYPSQNYDGYWNGLVTGSTLHTIARTGGVALYYFDGYLADIHFIDGQALTPSSFTETSATTGQLIPKAYSGSFGTNGFWLKFSDNSAATATTLGKDYSGNGNNWTPNNLAVDSAGFSNTIASSQVWSNYLTPSSYWQNSTRDATKAFDNDITTFAYVPENNSTEYINFSFPSGISNHGGFIWLRGGNGNGQGLDNMTVTINGATVSSTARTGTAWNNWFKFPVSGPLTSFRITGVYPVLNAVSFWSDYSTIVLDSQAITYGALAVKDGDSLVDTPTSYGTDTGAGGEVRGNYATLNPINKNSGLNLLNGNLDATWSSGSALGASATIALPTSGKWYCEITNTGSSGIGYGIGISDSGRQTFTNSGILWAESAGSYYRSNGDIGCDGKATQTGSTYATGDIISIAYDAATRKIWFAKNGTWQLSGNPASGTNEIGTLNSPTGNYFFGFAIYDTNTGTANFGQRPFAYTAPSGFKALCDTSLPAPVVAKPSTVMDVKLYTGNGTSQTISGLGFSPDFVWLKSRGAAYNHQLFDTIRGTGKQLFSNLTSAETTESFSWLNAFNSNGFGVTGAAGVNDTNDPMVAWCFDAGSSTSTNTAGSITSSVRANASAGFSIVTYTGNGTGGATVGHGGLVNLANGMIIVKRRDSAVNWFVGHGSQGWTKVFEGLNTTAAISTSSAAWNNTSPTSTVFTLGTETSMNGNGGTFVAYCFAPVAGYSSFGSYTGNGSTDGPMCWTGFSPSFIIVKRTDAAGYSWIMKDNKRPGYNSVDLYLSANSANAEGGGFDFDFTSNGFKLRVANANLNASSGTYVWAAFAESPFAYSRAR